MNAKELAWALFFFWAVASGCTMLGRGGKAGRVSPGPPASSIECEWLGVTVQDVPEAIAQYYSLGKPRGAVVTAVKPEKPGAKGGLEWGDLILTVDGVEVGSAGDLAGWSGVLARESVKLGILRAGGKGDVAVSLGPKSTVGRTTLEEKAAADAKPVEGGPGSEAKLETERASAVGAPVEAKPAHEAKPAEREPASAATLPAAEAKPAEVSPAKKAKPTSSPAVAKRAEEKPVEAPKASPTPEPADRPRAETPPVPPAPSFGGTAGSAATPPVPAQTPEPESGPPRPPSEASDHDRPEISAQGQQRGKEPARPASLEETAFQLFSQGRVSEALTAYRELAAQRPEDVEVLNNLGAVLSLLGRQEEALGAFDRAVAASPTFAKAHFNRGLALWNLAQMEEALQAYRRARTLDPTFVEAWLAEADGLLQLGRLEQALEVNGGALAVRPGGPDLLRQRGDILKAAGRLDAAEAVFRRALESAPQDPDLLLALGICLDEQGRPAEAVGVFDRLLTGEGGSATAYHNRALARFRMGDAAGALSDEDAALLREPRFSAAQVARAQALEKLDRTEDAIDAWGRVLDQDPKSPSAREGLERLAARLAGSPDGIARVRVWLLRAGAIPPGAEGASLSMPEGLARFQARQGLKPTGTLDGVTLLRLARLLDPSAPGARD